MTTSTWPTLNEPPKNYINFEVKVPPIQQVRLFFGTAKRWSCFSNRKFLCRLKLDDPARHGFAERYRHVKSDWRKVVAQLLDALLILCTDPDRRKALAISREETAQVTNPFSCFFFQSKWTATSTVLCNYKPQHRFTNHGGTYRTIVSMRRPP